MIVRLPRPEATESACHGMPNCAVADRKKPFGGLKNRPIEPIKNATRLKFIDR